MSHRLPRKKTVGVARQRAIALAQAADFECIVVSSLCDATTRRKVPRDVPRSYGGDPVSPRRPEAS